MLKNNTLVKFNIDDIDTGEAVIRASILEENDSIAYRIEVLNGSFASVHRNKEHELWVNDYEVEVIDKLTESNVKKGSWSIWGQAKF